MDDASFILLLEKWPVVVATNGIDMQGRCKAVERSKQ
jgi:hypothetical protein